ncbi:response regulator [Sphingobacteriaceae bacterium AH-315-L07]|nr:response regulator [Sphingobacteriaceae bacterium AH-315-L07]
MNTLIDSFTDRELILIILFAGLLLYSFFRRKQTARKNKERLQEILKYRQQEKEAAESKAQSKSEFLSEMGHELRTPLNGIIGMTNMLLSKKLNGDELYYSKSIKKSADRLLRVINEVLDLSKLEAKKMKLSEVTVNLEDFIKENESSFITQAKSRNNQLTYKVLKEIPRFLIIDDLKLNQVLTNLVSNALKNTEDGTVEVQFLLEAEKKDGIIIKVIVKDSGIGIPKEDQQILFKAFSQVDTSLSRYISGTGLGLNICAKLVKLLGGDIGVESIEGKGSTFWFTFRTKAGNAEDCSIENASNEAYDISELTDKNIRILIVDDDTINQEILELFLKATGCFIETANNGKDGVTMATNDNYDLILMDLHMPIMNGKEAATKIKNALKEKSPPIIAITANTMDEGVKELLENGMDDFIGKPIDQKELINKLSKWTKTNKSDFDNKLPTPENYELFDMKKVDQIKALGDGNSNIYQDLIKTFFDGYEKLLPKIESGLENKNKEDLTFCAHKLRGSASAIGAMAIHDAAKITEEFLNADDLIEGVASMKEIKQTVSETKIYVKEKMQLDV